MFLRGKINEGAPVGKKEGTVLTTPHLGPARLHKGWAGDTQCRGQIDAWLGAQMGGCGQSARLWEAPRSSSPAEMPTWASGCQTLS